MKFSLTITKSFNNKLINLSALLLFAVLSSNSFAVPILDQSYEVSEGCCFGIGQASSGGAQTFTVGTSGQLTGFDVTLQGYDYDTSYDGDVTFQIRDSSFTSVLFSTTVAKSTISTASFIDYLFDVSAANILVSAGDVLAIVIEETGLGALSWNADFGSAATYAGGSSWSLFSGNYFEYTRDGAFHTYVEAGAEAGAMDVPEPSTIALFFLGLAGLGFSGKRKHQF